MLSYSYQWFFISGLHKFPLNATITLQLLSVPTPSSIRMEPFISAFQSQSFLCFLFLINRRDIFTELQLIVRHLKLNTNFYFKQNKWKSWGETVNYCCAFVVELVALNWLKYCFLLFGIQNSMQMCIYTTWKIGKLKTLTYFKL